MKVTVKTKYGYLIPLPPTPGGLARFGYSPTSEVFEIGGLEFPPTPLPEPTPPEPPQPPLPIGEPFDFSTAVQHDGPTFTHWSATAKIIELNLNPAGVHITFDKQDVWPNIRPTGWDGDLQYCIGMAMKINGQWHVSAPMQCWKGIEWQGGNVGDATVQGKGGQVGQVWANWFYDARWGEMQRQPQAGEEVGFFVVAGSVRGGSAVISVEERSNVVVVPFPTAAGASHTW